MTGVKAVRGIGGKGQQTLSVEHIMGQVAWQLKNTQGVSPQGKRAALYCHLPRQLPSGLSGDDAGYGLRLIFAVLYGLLCCIHKGQPFGDRYKFAAHIDPFPAKAPDEQVAYGRHERRATRQEHAINGRGG